MPANNYINFIPCLRLVDNENVRDQSYAFKADNYFSRTKNWERQINSSN